MASFTEIQKIIRTHKDVLFSRFKVQDIGVFGSYARGEEIRASDVDILVEFSEPVGWEFVDLKEYLEGILECPVDLVKTNALKRQLQEKILKEVRMI